MPVKGFICDEEYREKYFASPKVKEHLEVFIELAKQPKSEAVKLKMSLAKQHVPKTEEHKQNLSLAQKHRHELFRKLKSQCPNMTKEELWAEVKEIIRIERCT